VTCEANALAQGAVVVAAGGTRLIYDEPVASVAFFVSEDQGPVQFEFFFIKWYCSSFHCYLVNIVQS
jgi:hypothetical protein